MRSDRPVILLGLVAETAADLIATKDPTRIHRCGNPSCVLFFYDATRNPRPAVMLHGELRQSHEGPRLPTPPRRKAARRPGA